MANGELSSMKPSIKGLTKLNGPSTWYSINGIKANARKRVEQDVDLVLKNLKLKKFWPTTWGSATNNRQPIYAPERKWGSYHPERWPTVPEKLITSKTTKILSGSNLLIEYSRACTENLELSLESPRQKKCTDRNTIIQTWRNWSKSGSCHMSNVSRNNKTRTHSPTHSCKAIVNTIEDHKTPCRLTSFRNCFRQAALKTLLQL